MAISRRRSRLSARCFSASRCLSRVLDSSAAALGVLLPRGQSSEKLEEKLFLDTVAVNFAFSASPSRPLRVCVPFQISLASESREMERWVLIPGLKFGGCALDFDAPTLGAITPCAFGWLFLFDEDDAPCALRLDDAPKRPSVASLRAFVTARFEAPFARRVSSAARRETARRRARGSAGCDAVVMDAAKDVGTSLEVEGVNDDVGSVAERTRDRRARHRARRTREELLSFFRQTATPRVRGSAEVHVGVAAPTRLRRGETPQPLFFGVLALFFSSESNLTVEPTGDRDGTNVYPKQTSIKITGETRKLSNSRSSFFFLSISCSAEPRGVTRKESTSTSSHALTRCVTPVAVVRPNAFDFSR